MTPERRLALAAAFIRVERAAADLHRLLAPLTPEQRGEWLQAFGPDGAFRHSRNQAWWRWLARCAGETGEIGQG